MNQMEKAVKLLLSNKPFYAHFLLNSKVIYNDYDRNDKSSQGKVLTAAASIKKLVPNFEFNMPFLNSLTVPQTASVIEHEIMHVMFEHVYLFANKEWKEDRKIANIAMDCAINQYIENRPDGSITLESVSELVGKKLKPFHTWQYYYSELLKKAKVVMESDIGPDDDHDQNSDSDVSEDLQKAVLRSTVDKAVKASNGNVPEHFQHIIASLSVKNQLNWKTILRNFVARSTASVTRNTRRKVNRRFDIDAPGKLKKRELVLGVCVDSSGSISNESYEQFMAEIVNIAKYTLKTIVIDADCEVHNIEVIKKGKTPSLVRHGAGGTAYQPAIDACSKYNCDAIIYFGDFDTSDSPTNPGIPFLWVGVGDQPKPADFGFEVRLN